VPLTRQRPVRSAAARLALEHAFDCTRDARAAARLALSLTDRIGVFGALAGASFGLALARWRQIDASAPRLRQTDRDRLPRRAGAVHAATDLVDLLVHELARLGRGRLALALVLARLLDGSLVRHDRSPGIASNVNARANPFDPSCRDLRRAPNGVSISRRRSRA